MSQNNILAGATMKLAVALALALSACAKKESYVSAKGGTASFIKDDVTTQTAEQKATEILAQDTEFTNVRQNEQSQDLRESVVSAQAETTSISTPSGESIEALRITFLDRNCVEREKVISVQEKAQIMSPSGLAMSNFTGVQGVLRLNCLDEICNGLLVRIQQQSNAMGQGNHSDIPKAEASVILVRSENGVFQPFQTENNQFIQASNLEEARVACLQGQQPSDSGATELQNPKVREALRAGTRAAAPAATVSAGAATELQNPQVSEALRRNEQLAKIDQEIKTLEDSLTSQLVSTVEAQNALRRLTELKAQRVSLQSAVQKQTMSAISATYDLKTPALRDAVSNKPAQKAEQTPVTPVNVPFGDNP